MSLRAYRLARASIFDAARRRMGPNSTLRDALGYDDTVALIACRVVTQGLSGALTQRLFSRLGAHSEVPRRVRGQLACH